MIRSQTKGIAEQTILIHPLPPAIAKKKFNNKKERWKIASYCFIIV